MPFPETPRVEYRRNPLEFVVCQVRFPPILRVEAALPVEFQERVRGRYPMYSEGQTPKAAIAVSVSQQLPAPILRQSQQFVPVSGTARTYQFASEDNAWRLTLTSEFIALRTSRYSRWQDFREWLDHPLSVLIDVYAPLYATRVGLRYHDVIRRSGLGLSEIPWAELLKPHLLGELGEPSIGEHVKGTERRVAVDLVGMPGTVLVSHFLGRDVNTGEACYVIDSDFSVDERMEFSGIADWLDTAHRKAGNLFRWYIGDRLHEAMGPMVL